MCVVVGDAPDVRPQHHQLHLLLRQLGPGTQLGQPAAVGEALGISISISGDIYIYIWGYLDVVDSVLISSVHLEHEDGEADGPGGGQRVGRGVGH